MNLSELQGAIRAVFVDQRPPKSLDLVEPLARVLQDAEDIAAAAALADVPIRRLQAVVEAPDPLLALLGEVPEFTPDVDARWRSVLGQQPVNAFAG